MKVPDAMARVRETMRGGGDAETTAWACAAQMDTETVRKLAASWLVEAARNAERSAVRQIERDSTVAKAPKSRPQVSAEMRADWNRRDAERQSRFLTSMKAALETYAAEIKVEWTRELLEQTFVVDGKTVTWGAATVQQHAARRDQFMTSAASAVEAATRHEAAIRDLQQMGAANLDELVGIAA